MKRILNSWVALLLLLFLASCSNLSITKSEDYKTQLKTHKLIAILPVHIQSMGKRVPPGETYELIRKRNEEMGYLFQKRMYEHLDTPTDNKKVKVAIQPIAVTDSILHSHDINLSNIFTHNPKDLAALLGVDAVVYSNIDITYNMSDGASIAVKVASAAILPGGLMANVPPGEATVQVRVVSVATGLDVWKYDSAFPHAFTMAEHRDQEILFRRFLWFPTTKMPYSKN